MPTKLTWPNESRFRGGKRFPSVDVVGPATVEVPDDAVDHLKSRGWTVPDDADASATDNGTGDSAESADDVDTSDTDDGNATATDDGSGEFDAGAFIDGDWRAVRDAITAGDADGHLDAVEAAEQARNNGARDSVMGALEERREDLEED